MVDGTGLENQQINVSQVRILSLPPSIKRRPLGLIFILLWWRQDENRRFAYRRRRVKISNLFEIFQDDAR